MEVWQGWSAGWFPIPGHQIFDTVDRSFSRTGKLQFGFRAT
jgi:hypothetical protein